MAEFRRAFGAEVRAVRARKGMTQGGLAEQARMARSHLSQIEAGDVSPSLDVQVRIAQALGLTIDELLRRAREEHDGKV